MYNRSFNIIFIRILVSPDRFVCWLIRVNYTYRSLQFNASEIELYLNNTLACRTRWLQCRTSATATATRAVSAAGKNTATEFTTTPMATPTLETGSTMSNKATGFIPSPMDRATKEISKREPSMERDILFTNRRKKTIWQNMSAVGNSANPTERVEHTTAMATIMRVTLSVEWEVGSVSLCSTKISNTRVNGETQFFKALENCTVTENCSLRVGFKTGWSTEAGNTNTKMEIISKEFTSKTKNEATVVITLPKAAFLSHSSTPFLPKSPK